MDSRVKNGDDISTSREIVAGSTFTARDLSLCSDSEARSFLSCADALSVLALPLSLSRGSKGLTLYVASVEATPQKAQALRFLTGIDVSISETPEAILKSAITMAYLGSEERLTQALERVARPASKTDTSRADPVLTPRGDAAEFITALLEFAAVRGASDLHLVPQDDGAVIKMRIDGELLTQKEKPYGIRFHEQVVSRLKVLASIDIASKLVPHDGALSFTVGDETRHARVSTLPTAYGESVVVRLLARSQVASLNSLGMEPQALKILRQAMRRNDGIVLLTGPTGSGKTTTMYAVVVELDGQGNNVVTVEDPVETPIPGMVQVQVSLTQGLDYPRAIRSVLRHDPDVLLIGEIRDGLSATIALDAASTGHLTFASLHVGSALHAIKRLEILGVPPAQSIPPVAVVMNQRLLPKLCPSCKRQGGVPMGNPAQPIYCRGSCGACRETGYLGRVLITEVLDLQSQGAKEAYYRAGQIAELLELLPTGCFIPWTDSLQYHLCQGDISLEQVEQFVSRELR